MTKEEATNAMLNGAKVTHPHLWPGQFFYMESARIYNQHNTLIVDFWERRSHDEWQINWSIYRD